MCADLLDERKAECSRATDADKPFSENPPFYLLERSINLRMSRRLPNLAYQRRFSVQSNGYGNSTSA